MLEIVKDLTIKWDSKESSKSRKIWARLIVPNKNINGTKSSIQLNISQFIFHSATD